MCLAWEPVKAPPYLFTYICSGRTTSVYSGVLTLWTMRSDPADYLAIHEEITMNDDAVGGRRTLLMLTLAVVAYSDDQKEKNALPSTVLVTVMSFESVFPLRIEAAFMLDTAPGLPDKMSQSIGYGITDTMGSTFEDEIIYFQLDDARFVRSYLEPEFNQMYRDRHFPQNAMHLLIEEDRPRGGVYIVSLGLTDRWMLSDTGYILTGIFFGLRSGLSSTKFQWLQAAAPVLQELKLQEEASCSSYDWFMDYATVQYMLSIMGLFPAAGTYRSFGLYGFRGTEGVVDLTQWFERMETVFCISNCIVENQVKFATCTLMGTALTWWNTTTAGQWDYWMMFPKETDKIERYVGGMPDLIYSSVVASKPKTMQGRYLGMSPLFGTYYLNGLPPTDLWNLTSNLVPGAEPLARAPYSIGPISMKGYWQQINLNVRSDNGLYDLVLTYGGLQFYSTSMRTKRIDDNIGVVEERGVVLLGISDDSFEGFSMIAQTLTKLTQKKVKFEWGDKQETAFQLLKQKLCSAPILALPRNCRRIEHETTPDGFELLSEYDCDIRYHTGKANLLDLPKEILNVRLKHGNQKHQSEDVWSPVIVQDRLRKIIHVKQRKQGPRVRKRLRDLIALSRWSLRFGDNVMLKHVNAIATRSGKTCEGPSTPLVPTPVVSTPLKEPEQNLETSMDKVKKSILENTAQVLPLEEEESIFKEIPKQKAKKIVNIEIQEPKSPKPTSYQPKLPYPERMKVRENDKPSAQHSQFLKMFKQLRLEIGLKDALVEMPKFNKWLSSLLRNKEKLEKIAITTLDRTNALADSGASINRLPHSIYKQLGLEALTPTRMTLELANRSITHPMGIAEDVVVRVDGFTFLADFVVVNFEPDPRVPIILGRPFLRTAKALIDLYEETLTLRVGKEELVYYADKSEKNKDKNFVHAISVIDFSKDDPFSGSTTTHSDDPSPSSSPVKTSDNLEEFADELTLLKKDVQEGNFQDLSNPLFEFDDNFKSGTINPLFDEMEEDVEIKNFNVFDEPVLLNTPLYDKIECFAPEDDNDKIDAFLAMEVSSNFEEGYFDSEGDVTFLDNLLSNDASHNLASEVISDHEPEQNESSITFSPKSDPLHHEFAGELLTLPSRNDREFGEYLSLMTVLCEISTSQSQENVHANQSSVIESLPVSPIPVEDSEPAQEEIDIFLVPDDLIPPGVENDDSEDEDNELPNLDHQDDPSIPRPPPEPPDVEKCFEPEAGILITKVFKGVSKPHDFMADILPTLPTLVLDLTFILFLSSFLSFRSEDTIFDPASSLIAGGPHRNGTFQRFNVCPTLMKAPIEFFFSFSLSLRQINAGIESSLRLGEQKQAASWEFTPCLSIFFLLSIFKQSVL
ncbi:reverse transcriptase domain-containing protein [Tanacetum coccineum]